MAWRLRSDERVQHAKHPAPFRRSWWCKFDVRHVFGMDRMGSGLYIVGNAGSRRAVVSSMRFSGRE